MLTKLFSSLSHSLSIWWCVKRLCCWSTLISIHLLHIHFPFSFFIHQITLFMFSPFSLLLLSLTYSLTRYYSIFKFMPGTTQLVWCSFLCICFGCLKEVKKALKFAVAEKKGRRREKVWVWGKHTAEQSRLLWCHARWLVHNFMDKSFFLQLHAINSAVEGKFLCRHTQETKPKKRDVISKNLVARVLYIRNSLTRKYAALFLFLYILHCERDRASL